MKLKKFLVTAISTAAISGGALICSMGVVQACPLGNKLSNLFGGNSSNPTNTAKIIGKTAGSAALGGLVVGGVYLSRRLRKSNGTQQAEQAAAYKALEFPENLPNVHQFDSKRSLIRNRE